jgi:hypothetical protein
MIQYNNYKRFYVDAGVFSLNNADYTGYVEVLSGIPYVAEPEVYYDRCLNLSTFTRQQLEKKTTYKTDIYWSNLFYDRIITDNTNLPYSLESILFDTNELLNYGVLKDKIQKAYQDSLSNPFETFLKLGGIQVTKEFSTEFQAQVAGDKLFTVTLMQRILVKQYLEARALALCLQ